MAGSTIAVVTARTLILYFFAHVREARLARIVAFMEARPLAFAPGTTKNVLSKLTIAGEIERIGAAKYRVTGMDVEAPAEPG